MTAPRIIPAAVGPGRVIATTIRAVVGSEYLIMRARGGRR
jgi:hypothetical protein